MDKNKGFVGTGFVIALVILAGIAGGTYVITHRNAVKTEISHEQVSDQTSDAAVTDNRQSGDPHENTDGKADITIDEGGVHVTAPKPEGSSSTVGVGGETGVQSQSQEWFYVPELHAKFKKTDDFTPQYTVTQTYPTLQVTFTSKEMLNAISQDQHLSGCADFGTITFASTSKSQEEFQGYDEVSLGNGFYLRNPGHQAPCWASGSSQEALQFLSQQSKLFVTFFHSAKYY